MPLWFFRSELMPVRWLAIASQILEAIKDEEAWRRRFAAKRDLIRRMADVALAEDGRAETVPLDDVL